MYICIYMPVLTVLPPSGMSEKEHSWLWWLPPSVYQLSKQLQPALVESILPSPVDWTGCGYVLLATLPPAAVWRRLRRPYTSSFSEPSVTKKVPDKQMPARRKLQNLHCRPGVGATLSNISACKVQISSEADLCCTCTVVLLVQYINEVNTAR